MFCKIPKILIFLFSQLERRMKIAELKQVSARPDVVEVMMHLYFEAFSYLFFSLLLVPA